MKPIPLQSRHLTMSRVLRRNVICDKIARAFRLTRCTSAGDD